MLSLHTHQPLLIQLHATLYYRRNNATTNKNSSTATANTLNHFHSQKLPPVTFAADTVIPCPSYDSAINDDSHITLNPHITLSSQSHTLDHNPTTPTTPNSNNNNNTPTPNLSHNRTGSRRGSTPPDLFLRSLDNSCLARVHAMTRHTAFCFERVVNYEVERSFVWAGVGAEGLVGSSARTRAAGTTGTTGTTGTAGTAGTMGMIGTLGLGSLERMVEEGMAEEGMVDEGGVVAGAGCGAGAMATASLSMRGLSSTEIARQVDMMRRRGYRDWVRVEMAVEIEAGRELREREDVGWLTGVQKGEGEVEGWSE